MSCKLSYICEKKWDELKETGKERIRYCDKCKKDVFLVSSVEEFEECKLRDRCVAYAEDFKFDDLVEKHKFSGMMGWPDRSLNRLLNGLEKNKNK